MADEGGEGAVPKNHLLTMPALSGPAYQRCLWAGGGCRAGPWCGAGRNRRPLHSRAGHTQAAVHPSCEPGHSFRHARQAGGACWGLGWGPSAPQLLMAPAGLPFLSLSFPSVDGSCTLGEGHVPKMGKTEVAAQVIPCPNPSTPSPACPLAHPGPVARADVSSLGKGLARPGRRPMPVGAIRRRADGTNSCWPAGPSTGVAILGGVPQLSRPQGHPSRVPQSGGSAMKRGGVWSEGGDWGHRRKG